MADQVERCELKVEMTNGGARIHVSVIDETTKEVHHVKDLAPVLSPSTLSALLTDVNTALRDDGLPTIPVP